MNVWGILSVAQFELRRLISIGRILGALFLIVFPPGLTWVVQMRGSVAIPDSAFALIISFLILQVTCGMSLLSLATTIVSSELEANTWVYVATRRRGRVNLILGKYLVAALVAGLIGSLSATLLMPFTEIRNPERFWLSLVALSFMAAFSYAALFVTFGTWIQRRAMAVAVVYMLLIEGVMGLIPAAANQFTVSFRLRSLLANWMDWKDIPADAERFFEREVMYTHVIVLALMIVTLLSVSLIRVRWGEYPTNTQD